MSLIGMPEAGRRVGMTSDGLRRALMGAGVPLTRINEKAIAVDEADLAAFVAKRGQNPGRGRPQGTKNRPREGKPREYEKLPETAEVQL